MLNIVSSILRVYGTKSYLNGVELPIETKNDNDTSDFEANSSKISNNFKQGLIRASKMITIIMVIKILNFIYILLYM